MYEYTFPIVISGWSKEKMRRSNEDVRRHKSTNVCLMKNGLFETWRVDIQDDHQRRSGHLNSDTVTLAAAAGLKRFGRICGLPQG